MAKLRGFNRVVFIIYIAIIPNLLMSAHVGVHQMENPKNCSTVQNGTNCTADFPFGINGTIPSNGNSEEPMSGLQLTLLIVGLSIACGLIFCISTCIVKTLMKKCHSNAPQSCESTSSEIFAPNPIFPRRRYMNPCARSISRHRHPQRFNARHADIIDRGYEMQNVCRPNNIIDNRCWSDGNSDIISTNSSTNDSNSIISSSSNSNNSIENIRNYNSGASSTVDNTAEGPATLRPHFSAYKDHAETVDNDPSENSLLLSESTVSNPFLSAIEKCCTQAPTEDNPLLKPISNVEENIKKEVENNLSHALYVTKVYGTGKMNTESKVEQPSLNMKTYQGNLHPMANNENIPDSSADLGLSEEEGGSPPRADHGVDMPAENDTEISDDAGELKTEIETIAGGLPEPQDVSETALIMSREMCIIDMEGFGVDD